MNWIKLLRDEIDLDALMIVRQKQWMVWDKIWWLVLKSYQNEWWILYKKWDEDGFVKWSNWRK